MKLTKNTIPQARNYQCDKCKRIYPHIDMYDDKFCYDCKNEEEQENENKTN